MHQELIHLAVDCLQPGRYQPRQNFSLQGLEELAQSIASQGLIEPIVVRALAKEKYEIIAGERRFRAAKIAGLSQIPCLLGNYSEKQAAAVGLIENIQRQDLNLIEEATAYRRLIDESHYQQEELAILVGKSRSHIANILRLLTLSEPVQQLIRQQSLSLGHARLLVGLTHAEQAGLVEEIIKNQWSVRQLEALMHTVKNAPEVNGSKKDRDVARLELILADQLGTPVQIIQENTQGGWLKVKFFDNDTLAGLLERLGLSYD